MFGFLAYLILVVALVGGAVFAVRRREWLDQDENRDRYSRIGR